MNNKTARTSPVLRAAAVIGLVGLGLPSSYGATTYSHDGTLKDFTDTVSSYATFAGGSFDGGSFAGGYQPTSSILLAADYPRVIGNLGDPIYVSFAAATANIVVFDNIDHPGYAWDVFQYKISGSTDNVHFTELFNPAAVNEANIPNTNAAFTLKTYTGTAPTLLNNTITPGLGSWVGNVGYEEYFTFGSSYQYFQFSPSALTLLPGGENETELSAVGIGVPSDPILATDMSPVPEVTSSFTLFGLITSGLLLRRRATALR